MKISILFSVGLIGIILTGAAQASPGCNFVNAGGFNHTDTSGKYPNTNPMAFSVGDRIALVWRQGPPSPNSGYGRIDVVTSTDDWVSQFAYVDPDRPSATSVVSGENTFLSLTYIIAKGSSTNATCTPGG